MNSSTLKASSANRKAGKGGELTGAHAKAAKMLLDVGRKDQRKAYD